MARPTWKRGEPLSDAAQEKLRLLIKERGEVQAANDIGISRVSVVRAAAGSGVRRVTAIAIEAQLAALSRA